MTVTVEVDTSVIEGWLRPGGMVEANMEERAKRVVFGAQVRAPVRTGALRASGVAQRSSDTQGAWDALFAIYYAYFVDQGTIYMDPRYYLTYSLDLAIR